ncbi:MAG: pyridoxal 5'-phosphate synthase glutaminase subunit PdxT [Bacilli bacterium]|nr:pyridoxal 5'-phosphate synthase glutaminase subunit PdxT [Bacilli bacterium]
MVIGILGFQGSVIEHQKMIEKLGEKYKIVKKIEDLKGIDGIIFPGGESTTMAKLLHIFGLYSPLRDAIANGLPVFGTCAGMILLAKEIVGEEPHFGLMDIKVRRNAYGSQIDSFSTHQKIEEFGNHEIPLVFIRAPWIEEISGETRVLYRLDGKIVCARENNMLVSSFHPELTNDLSVHQYFIRMIEENNRG